ncbi:MAG: DUF3574 domain-containing protein [Pyrinomonadaceae bacterium]
MKKKLSAIILGFALLFPGQVIRAETAHFHATGFARSAAEKYYRTELYFGRSIPGGGLVTDEEWEQFLAEVVTPRFPDGFTILKGLGQYREKSGKVISEATEVLVFLYSRRTKAQSRAKIEEVRAAYIKRFKQESVLRVDLPKSVDVSF